MKPEVFYEATSKLFQEFYPDVREFTSGLSKDICNKLPKDDNPYYDGILTTVLLSLLSKEIAVVLAPIKDELVDEMIARLIFSITAWVPELKEDLNKFVERERENN